jgi:hypothetical protein
VDDAEEARQLGRAHEAQPEEPDWSILESWLRHG